MLIALLFLGAGGAATTGFAWYLARLTAEKSDGPWPIAYALYGALVLIGITLTGFSYVLGKRSLSIHAGRDGLSADTDGGQDEDVPAEVRP
jgi:hypothetical protein